MMARNDRAGFREALASEWTKFWSIRSTRWTLAVTGALVPVFAVIVAVTGSLQPDDTILGASLTAVVPAQLFAAVLGALVITSEYRAGTIHTTLTAVPRRVTVLAAKTAVVASTLLAVMLVSSAAAFLIGTQMLDRDQYVTGAPWPALVGVALSFAVIGVLGLAVGTALRHSVGATAATAAALLVPGFVSAFFGQFQPWVGGASATAAVQKLTQTSDASPETVGSLGGWASLAVVAAYTAVVAAASAWLLIRRDA